jgi:hypothetical protein
MHAYPNQLKLKDALQLYFSRYHFANGGYNLKWFKIKIGPIFIPLPNTKARIAAVKLHDIHHITNEYEANLKGEAEIGAWEIASGCGKYYVAWLLNFASFFYGLFFFPRAVYKAFMKGRKAATNFYHFNSYNNVLFDKTVGELRAIIQPTLSSRNSFTDHLWFCTWCLLVLLPVGAFLTGLYFIFH